MRTVAVTTEDGYRVEGRILFDNGLPADEIRVRVYHRSYGCNATLLGETRTDGTGFYRVSYVPVGMPVNLEVRAEDTGGRDVSLSATRYNAQIVEVLNLIAPASIRPMASEYDRLKADLSRHLGERGRIAEAHENPECPDISLLHHATRWDARLIVLLARAALLTEDLRISEAALYALFRCGLPTERHLLARFSVATVRQTLEKAVAAGIVNLDEGAIEDETTAFEKFSREARHGMTAAGGLSSFADLLRTSGLNENEQGLFADLYFAHRGSPAELWQMAADRGISETGLKQLKLQGKLSYLTLNNAELAAVIQQELGSEEKLARLVDQDLYQEEAWTRLLDEVAGRNEMDLDSLIPPAYQGEDTQGRLQAYASDLARKVRQSHPTRVIARMVEKDELHLGEHHEALKAPVNTVLKNAEGLGFSLGRAPINQFIKSHHEDLFQGVSEADVAGATQAMKKLHRLYQVTPTDQALQKVLDAGFGSAYEIAAVPYSSYMKSYGDQFSTDPAVSVEVASQVYRKAQQVASVTYNFFTYAKQMDSAPAVYAVSPPAGVVEEAKNELIKHFPTMESLFGSLDFCECEHCRSVLSPAAYLVDLLQFLDPDGPSWDTFKDNWSDTHNGEEYTADHLKAYDALVERRPDLPHLPLTCENTNTAMPYIDIVNEILEYYVATGGLDPAAVRDTGNATTPELLAEPQNILKEAYDNKIGMARYPIGLPFDLWLETVRRFCDHFGLPLWQVLHAWRRTEKLYAEPADQVPYDLSAVFTEYLGISPDEHKLMTDAGWLADWHKLYGFDDGQENEALTALASAKTLSRRLGVSYKQVVELVRTGFVNPRLNALVVLQKLGVDISDVFRYKNNEALLSQDESTLSPEELKLFKELEAFRQRLLDLSAAYAPFDAVAWLNQAWQDHLFDEALVLADPDGGCNFDATILRHADGTSVDGFVLLKINLFVRLWRKLGWTIEETDRALQTFVPASSLPLTGANIGAALKTALLYLAHLKWLDGSVKGGDNRRIKLLTLWSSLPTTGSKPLYAQLFLTRSVLKQDAVFDDPLGQYLSQGGVLIKDHLPALQAALSLTADDIGSILADVGLAMDTAGLSLENVSILYRHGFLAKALKLSISELIALKSLSGLDPFAPLSPNPLTTLDEDSPFARTVRFITTAAAVRESGLRIEDLDYLFRHSFDAVGRYRPSPEALSTLVRTLAAGSGRIRDEHAAPAGITDELLRQKLSLVLTPEALTAFLAAVTGNAEAEAAQDNVLPAQRLDPKAFAGEPRIRVDYSDVLQRQRLAWRGLMTDAVKSRLGDAGPALLSSLLDQAQTLGFSSLAEQISAALGSLIDTAEYHAIRENVQPSDRIDPSALAGEPAVRVAYDEARAIQRLTWRGLLLDAQKQALNGLVNSPVLADLLDSVQAQGKAEAEALINGALAMVAGTVEFSAVANDVQLSQRLDPQSFEPRIRVSYEDAPAWDAAKAYQVDDAVSHSGSIWIALQANTNVTPVNGAVWMGPQGRKQSMTVQGLLSAAKRAQIEGDNAPQFLKDLLGSILDQSNAFIQKLRVGLLASGDFTPLFSGLAALSDSSEDPRLRLTKAIAPFILRKLTRQLAIETVASALGADRDLTEALMTDGSLLVDPTQPDNVLAEAYLAAGDTGVTAAFYAAEDGSGAPLEVRLAPTAATAGKPVGTNSAHFAGYIQVPAAGPYRFFARAALQNMEIELRLDDAPEPLLQGTAAANDAEFSAFVQLKSGVLYGFQFKAHQLNGGDAELLVQGENLPKGTLVRLMLSPAESVERVRRADVLLTKSLQLTGELGLTQRELRHLLTHVDDFGVSLNKLPTRSADASPAQALALFDSFLRLVEYTRLRREVAGETEDLIGVFEKVRSTPLPAADALLADLSQRFADLTRRNVETVVQTATSLGFSGSVDWVAAGFAQEKGIRRLWDALQAVDKLGVTVGVIAGSTEIINPAKTAAERFAIAGDLRNTVKARYEPGSWQRIAQPIFDKLRQRQRDALVAYIMHRKDFARIEELFEYFLIDPGMEPVVQTSRLRLAISSVQLFIQRCLLNLELKVDPSAINASHWEWMKRYRVWEANRKIFLFPENWLEPEFRDDKTHLFQELESTLLAGEVSNDLVEDAFLAYLGKLEELARLDIVAIYPEERPLDPRSNTIHVIGRTFSRPYKYFYRRYRHRMWTPWEPVPLEVDGDHVVAVVWRQRLHLFWVTFIEKAKQNESGDPIPVDFSTGISVPTGPERQIDVQLSWSEYFQGQWSTRESSGFSKPMTVDVAHGFASREVFIFAVKEKDDSGEEAAVRIQLSGEINNKPGYAPDQFVGSAKWTTAFRIVGRNSPAEVVLRSPLQPYESPYEDDGAEANRYLGSGPFEVTFVETVEKVEYNGGSGVSTDWVTKPILSKSDKFSLLIPGALPELVAPAIAHLVNPFFFADRNHTFYVEPTLTETTYVDWEDWAIPVAEAPEFDLPITAEVPEWVNPGGPVEIDPLARFDIQETSDWLATSGIVLQFDQALIGAAGGIDLQDVQIPGQTIGG